MTPIWIYRVGEDQRFDLVFRRLAGLTSEERLRLRKNISRVCFDIYNFDMVNGTYCPLAIAKNLHVTISNPTDRIIQTELEKEFNPVNVLKGVPGDFYHGTPEERKRDLLSVLNPLIECDRLDRQYENARITPG